MPEKFAPTEPHDGQRYRHKRRGGVYTVLGRARLQTERPLNEDETLVIYRGTDGELWARALGEFCDGRFEATPES